MAITKQHVPHVSVYVLFAVFSIFIVWNTAFAQSTPDAEITSVASTTEVIIDDQPWFTLETLPGGGAVAGDFVVGPGKVELEISPGESKIIMMSVSNRIGEPHIFNIEIEDMQGSSDPRKTVELLGGARGPYTLKDYIRVPGHSFELAHNKRARIPVTISVPADAEPGGRYGSVLVNTVAVKGSVAGGSSLTSQSPIISRIGTLFFITVPGEVRRDGEMKDFSTIPDKKWFEEGPVTFGLLFENRSSVHLTPYGTVSITNMLGDEVGYVELDPWFTLPNSFRLRDITWETEFLFGKYTATAEINRSYDNIVDTMTISFWVLPWKIVTALFVGIFTIFFLLRLIVRNFEFRRKE